MGPETKQEALAKLAMFTPKIGYPDSGATIARCASRGRSGGQRDCAPPSSNTQHNLDKLGKPVDRTSGT